MAATATKIAAVNYADDYDHIVRHVLLGKREQAALKLQGIPDAEIAPRLKRSIPYKRQLAVFRRDYFQCRYCARRTIFLPVLRLLSDLFPVEFRYHASTKLTVCHLAYWRDLASCDHLLPVARGGSSEIENLITACYMCNSRKQNWTVEELGWQMIPISESTLDGLLSRYLPLLELSGSESSYHKNWRAVVRRELS